MKYIFLIIALIITINTAHAETDAIDTTRKTLGYKLNQTVNELRDYFKDVKLKLSDNDNEATALDNDIEMLIDKSNEPEANSTILPQGKAKLNICLDNEELYWENNAWACKVPTYTSECEPAPGEYKIPTGDGHACIQNGSYSVQHSGWGPCNEVQMETQVKCMFKNSTTNFEYQTNMELCSASQYSPLVRYRRACGVNGASSSCKCPAGYTYKYYSKNVARCVGPLYCPAGYSFSSLYQKCVVPVNINVRITESSDSCNVGHYPASVDYINGVVDFGSSNGRLGNSSSHTHTTTRTVQITPRDRIQAKYIRVEGGRNFTFNGKRYSGSGRLNLEQNLQVGRTYTYAFRQQIGVGSGSTLVFNPKLYFLSLEPKLTPLCSHGSFNSAENNCISYVPECPFTRNNGN